jgi:hypothetical protein
MAERRFLGVTVMPEYFQTEGIDKVLDNLAALGATAVATSPYVMEPAAKRDKTRTRALRCITRPPRQVMAVPGS